MSILLIQRIPLKFVHKSYSKRFNSSNYQRFIPDFETSLVYITAGSVAVGGVIGGVGELGTMLLFQEYF